MAGAGPGPRLAGRGPTQLHGDLLAVSGGEGGGRLVPRHTGTLPDCLTSRLSSPTALTVQLHGEVAVLKSFILRLLAEHDVAVLGVDILAHLHPAGAELGDVGVVADVDGAVSAA